MESEKNFFQFLREMPRERLLILILSDLYLFGLIFHAVDFTLPYMLLLTPLVLLACGVAAIYPAARERSRSLMIWALVTYLVTLTLEIVGVKTGMVFGEYHYGPVLGLKFLGVPLVIGFNWLIVVLGAVRLTEKITPSPLLSGLLVGVMCVIYDYALEPVAIGLDYWQWHAGHIPLQNYMAWFVIAAVAGWAYRFFHVKMESQLPVWYVGLQFLFFLGLQIFVV